MGKQLDIYKRFKANNPDKYYLFKGGIFYYFLAEDAEYFNNKCGFKLTAFGDSVKCGFPVSALEKYLYLFKEENMKVCRFYNFTETEPSVFSVTSAKSTSVKKLAGT